MAFQFIIQWFSIILFHFHYPWLWFFPQQNKKYDKLRQISITTLHISISLNTLRTQWKDSTIFIVFLWLKEKKSDQNNPPLFARWIMTGNNKTIFPFVVLFSILDKSVGLKNRCNASDWKNKRFVHWKHRWGLLSF